MASWTTPVTHATGDILSVSDWNGVANNETFLYQAPYANYYNSVATSLTASAVTPVTIQGTTGANYGFSVSSTTNMVVPLTGIYLVTGLITITGGGAGSAVTPLVTEIHYNGTRVAFGTDGPTNYTYASSLSSTIYPASANSYFGLYGSNTYSAAFNTLTGPDVTYLAAYFLGSQ